MDRRWGSALLQPSGACRTGGGRAAWSADTEPSFAEGYRTPELKVVDVVRVRP